MKTIRVGINGMGRIGRLALRAGWERPGIEFVAINEPAGSADTLALLCEFDSVQGRWGVPCRSDGEGNVVLGERRLARSAHTDPAEIPWAEHGVDVVLECSGAFRTSPQLQPHLAAGARKVVVSVPVKDGPPNIVVGVNDADVDFASEAIVTAASCTTNCLAPIARVVHDALGIERGLVTTIHDPTNTQVIVDRPMRDPRRARAAGLNLIPTSTNSATAVTLIIPELAGKLDSIAVRAPVQNSSLTDCVFQVREATTVDDVNGVLQRAAETAPLRGILGFETRPLVSADFVGDPRSGIVDALSTRVTDRHLVKVLAWYDNEWGYAHRMLDLAERFAAALAPVEKR